MVAQTDDGGLGGGTPPVVTTVAGIGEFRKKWQHLFPLFLVTLSGVRKDESVR
jgi:hypothetical protein